MQVLLADDRFRAAPLPEAGTLVSELQTFEAKSLPFGHLCFEHREGQHDDLVLATALACWWSLRTAGPDDAPELIAFGKRAYVGLTREQVAEYTATDSGGYLARRSASRAPSRFRR